MTGEPAVAPDYDGRNGVGDFARVWGRALNSADYVPLLPAERSKVATALTARLAAALSAEPFDADRLARVGQRVGADLVSCGYAMPEVLSRTVTLMHTRLPIDLGLDGIAAARVTALVEAVVAGFVAAVRDRTLDAQDAVRLAAMTAQSRAEQALRASEARFRKFATQDALTALPNATLFTERLSDRLVSAEAGSRLAVCCIGLDRFASVNDSLGHDVGDRLLRAAAERLQYLPDEPGHLVARLDSDQFAVLVEETTCAEDAIKIIDLALAALAEPFHLDGTELPMTASAGIVEANAAGTDPADLVRAAQIALHWAKADGRACARLFEPERSAQDVARYRLSAAMPGALRRGELVLHYQPLVALATGQLVGVEALVRWHHPERGLLEAGEFIGLAEDTGLIVALGTHLLTDACRQAAQWQQLVADPPYVSVNLAPGQLQHPGVVGWVAEILDRSGLAPHRLQLELTERAVIDVAGATARTLAALAGLGVKIALDDFGVGYSNLTCLRALPLHRIKLDRTFIKPPRRAQARHQEFLAATVSLVRTLGLNITAEGIENAAQARRMRNAGCDTGQGWYLGRPVPADEITRAIHP
ncbi:MAG TPA: bifunctional diguanylate cyclase/phosphodiesterase [Micromonosporaceae bacterium]|nr:bifunctional diguanylate cyclase/phosphodiesterase [Micromonosporaceae bacterium]